MGLKLHARPPRLPMFPTAASVPRSTLHPRPAHRCSVPRSECGPKDRGRPPSLACPSATTGPADRGQPRPCAPSTTPGVAISTGCPRRRCWTAKPPTRPLGGDQLVIDVQTHYISNRPDMSERGTNVLAMAQTVAGDRFKGLDQLAKHQHEAGFSFAEYLRCIFLESETAVAVLSSAPGAEVGDKTRMLKNSEMIGTRELIDRLAGTGRLINHCVAPPEHRG